MTTCPGFCSASKLQEIYGIGERMEQHLRRACIFTVAELWRASPMRLRRVWGGINGLLFHQMLHGAHLPLRQKHGPSACA
jgi:nucleotidyltransferase/DNA polymerase involved in DNA repair